MKPNAMPSRQNSIRPLLADAADLHDDGAAAFIADHALKTGTLLRKCWEWDYIARCAKRLGLLEKDTVALGLGAGEELLIHCFAEHCGTVIASDLYSADSSWTTARKSEESILASSPIRYPRDRVKILNADMRSVPLPDESVDLVWSCSSIEHVPTLLDLLVVFGEAHRLLRSGGHMIFTTEFSLNSTYLLPSVVAWNRELYPHLIRNLPGFTALGDADFSFNAAYPGNTAFCRRLVASGGPIISLPEFNTTLLSRHLGSMATPLGISMAAPIGCVLRKTSAEGVLPWGDASLPDPAREYTNGVIAFFNGDNEAAISLTEAVYADAQNDLQLRHLAFRYAIDARARNGEMAERKKFAGRIIEFLDILPPGPLQDPDCLDLIAYLFGETGETDRSLDIYEKCIFSPSTENLHFLRLLLRYLVLAEKCGRFRQCLTRVSAVLFEYLLVAVAGGNFKNNFMIPAAKALTPGNMHLLDELCRSVPTRP